MNRLTFDGNFCDISQCRELPCPHGGNCTQRKVWEKLKAYEDLGLDPEEYERALSADIMVRVAAVALGVPAEALRDMVELGKAGRLMVLPESLEVHDDDKRWSGGCPAQDRAGDRRRWQTCSAQRIRRRRMPAA